MGATSACMHVTSGDGRLRAPLLARRYKTTPSKNNVGANTRGGIRFCLQIPFSLLCVNG